MQGLYTALKSLRKSNIMWGLGCRGMSGGDKVMVLLDVLGAVDGEEESES